MDIFSIDIDNNDVEKIDEYRRKFQTSVLTILFTDIEGSTKLREELGDNGYTELLDKHDSILLPIIHEHNGLHIKSIGDSILAVFHQPSDAVECSIAIQDAIYNKPLIRPFLKVRIGMDMGQIAREQAGGIIKDIFGRFVNRAARIEGLASGGHIFCSESVQDNATGWVDSSRIKWHNHGSHSVKGVKKSLNIWEPFNANITDHDIILKNEHNPQKLPDTENMQSNDNELKPGNEQSIKNQDTFFQTDKKIADGQNTVFDKSGHRITQFSDTAKNFNNDRHPKPPEISPSLSINISDYNFKNSDDNNKALSEFDNSLNTENSILIEPITGMEFVFIPGGIFIMGNIFDDDHRNKKELLPHKVELDEFYLAKYPVTQKQWHKVMGDNPSRSSKGDNYPVDTVSWNYTQKFIKKLTHINQGEYEFRLPSEAEWEYAARSGGKKELFAGGDVIDKYAWYTENSDGHTKIVGQKKTNGFGLYDMSGNVFEWCQDFYSDEAYCKHSPKNPMHSDHSAYRVFRGGSWTSIKNHVRCYERSYDFPGSSGNALGFRIVIKHKR
ncbi:MAG: SUMF1/EgtB/PvdO family nonheme iron enzyme [Desulfococcaceae bacterium]